MEAIVWPAVFSSMVKPFLLLGMANENVGKIFISDIFKTLNVEFDRTCSYQLLLLLFFFFEVQVLKIHCAHVSQN